MTVLRVSTAGESHGPCELCVVEGIPAGLRLASRDIDRELTRRQSGYGRGGRMAIETDRCRFVAGVRHGRTLGTPICVLVDNKDHENWSVAMSPYELSGVTDPGFSVVTVPRPGHADLSGVGKYGHEDIRNVLERASARETVGRVAAGAVCKRLLEEVNVVIRARVVSIGEVSTAGEPDFALPESVDWEAVEASPVGCDEPSTSIAMCEAIDLARQAGESLGGIFEIWCWGMCPGLGGYATIQDRLNGRLMQAMGSIPAIKGVEVGNGFANAGKPGSQVHDPLFVKEADGKRWIARETNRAGGLEGGMSTGAPIVMRVAMKPIPTLTTPLPSVDMLSLQPTLAHVERSDVTAVPAARVVGEAMAAQVLAGAYLDKFGGDSLDQLRGAVSSYEAGIEERGLWRRS